ncbi:hypothetical protein [Sphingobium abikonense]|uniref:hypothetical protein n=1 Tax=Sphingobium abikonense TaxID=86193 RepID=UPI0035184E00
MGSQWEALWADASENLMQKKDDRETVSEQIEETIAELDKVAEFYHRLREQGIEVGEGLQRFMEPD